MNRYGESLFFIGTYYEVRISKLEEMWGIAAGSEREEVEIGKIIEFSCQSDTLIKGVMG
jgi:hypothetical protein